MSDYNQIMESDLAMAGKLLKGLNASQRDLLIGLRHGTETTRSLLQDTIPTGTREFLLADDVIDEDGRLTELGRIIADEAAFKQGKGPNPALLMRAASTEASLDSAGY